MKSYIILLLGAVLIKAQTDVIITTIDEFAGAILNNANAKMYPGKDKLDGFKVGVTTFRNIVFEDIANFKKYDYLPTNSSYDIINRAVIIDLPVIKSNIQMTARVDFKGIRNVAVKATIPYIITNLKMSISVVNRKIQLLTTHIVMGDQPIRVSQAINPIFSKLMNTVFDSADFHQTISNILLEIISKRESNIEQCATVNMAVFGCLQSNNSMARF